MQNPIPGTLVRINDKILDPGENILIWDVDLRFDSILIQRDDGFLENHKLSRVRVTANVKFSPLAPGLVR